MLPPTPDFGRHGKAVWWALSAATYSLYPGVSFEGSGPGGIESGWDQGVKCNLFLCVCVDQ